MKQVIFINKQRRKLHHIRKLLLIQPAIKRMHKGYGNVVGKVVSARGELEKAQSNLVANRFDCALVDIDIQKQQELRKCTEDFRAESKLKWLK